MTNTDSPVESTKSRWVRSSVTSFSPRSNRSPSRSRSSGAVARSSSPARATTERPSAWRTSTAKGRAAELRSSEDIQCASQSLTRSDSGRHEWKCSLLRATVSPCAPRYTPGALVRPAPEGPTRSQGFVWPPRRKKTVNATTTSSDPAAEIEDLLSAGRIDDDLDEGHRENHHDHGDHPRLEVVEIAHIEPGGDARRPVRRISPDEELIEADRR